MRRGEHDEPTYEGRAGRTRREIIHFTTEGGAPRSASVTRVVNLGTDPQLREPLLTGALHRSEGAEDLVLSVVVHDPGARRVVIYLPEVIRHHELAERRAWLVRLEDDRESALPHYPQEPRVAIGLAQLRATLSEPTGTAVARRESTLAQKEEAIAKREELVSQREQRIRERAEQITRIEDEVRERAERNEAGERDLTMRESELEARLQALVDKERAHADKERSSAGAVAAPLFVEGAKSRESVRPRSVPPVASARGLSAPPRATLAPPSRPIAAIIADDDEIEEIDEIEPVSTSPGDRAEPSHAAGRFAVPVDRDRESMEAIEVRDAETVEHVASEIVEELVDEEDVEEEVDDAMLEAREDVTGLHVHDPRVTVTASREEETMLVATASEEGAALSVGELTQSDLSGGHTAIASVVEDDDSLPVALRDAPLAWKVGEDVELFVRTTHERLHESPDVLLELDLLVQLPPSEAPAELRSLVLVTLLDAHRAPLGRAALDPRETADRLPLESLRRRFEAKVVLHDGQKRLAEARLAAPRELNVARILERSARLRTEAAPGADAKERAVLLETPRPYGHVLLGDSLERAADAGAVRAVIRDVAEAISSERLEDAIVHASVSKDAIDATVARVIERALSYGLALPTQLTERAVATGLATDVGELVSRQITAFRATSQTEGSGLDREQIAENWERLLAGATDNEIALDTETHDLAHEAIRSVRGATPSVPPGGEVDPARIADAGVPELLLMLDHPRYRRAAAVALAERAGADHVEALCKAVRKMPRHEVVRVVPAIAKIGEEAGDALIDGLSAKKTFVRHAFAIALGHLKLRRAVVPLLHVLREEQSPVWKDIARVVGTFGNASLRAITRQTGDGKAADERTITALAHLANHGCEEALVTMTKESDARAARLAVHALSERDSARAWEDRVLGKLPAEETEPVQLFARRFQEELDGKAPEGELAGGQDE